MKKILADSPPPSHEFLNLSRCLCRVCSNSSECSVSDPAAITKRSERKNSQRNSNESKLGRGAVFEIPGKIKISEIRQAVADDRRTEPGNIPFKAGRQLTDQIDTLFRDQMTHER